MCPTALFGSAAAVTAGTVASGSFTILAPTAGLFGFGGVAGAAAGAGSIFSGISGFDIFKGVLNIGKSLFGGQQAQNYDQQNQIFAYNAQVAANNATVAEQVAQRDADIIDERKKRLLATQNVGFTASGVQLNTGTPLRIADDTTKEFALDRLDRLHAGDIEASAARASQANALNAAERSRINANQARNAQRFDVGSGILKFGGSLL